MITFSQEDDRFFMYKGNLEVWFPKATKDTVVSSVVRMVAITEQSFGDYLMKKVKMLAKVMQFGSRRHQAGRTARTTGLGFNALSCRRWGLHLG